MADWKLQAELLLGKVTELEDLIRTLRERLHFFETNCQCQANFSWCSGQLNLEDGSTTTTIVLTENLPGGQFDPQTQEAEVKTSSNDVDDTETNSMEVVQNQDRQISFINGQFFDGTGSHEYFGTGTIENADLSVCQEIVVDPTLTTATSSQDTWSTVAVEWNSVTGNYELSTTTRESYSIVDISDCHPVDSEMNSVQPSQGPLAGPTVLSISEPSPPTSSNQDGESGELGCDLCPRKFRSNKQLIRHKSLHTNHIEELTCKFCDKVFQSFKLYKVHLSTHSDVNTEISRSFSEDSIATPEELQHKLTGIETADPHRNSDVVKYNCCSENFSTRTAFLKHWDAHPIPQPRIKCQYCEETFGVKTAWLGHEKEHRDKMSETYDPKRSHQCELCGLAFLSRPHLNVHIRNHEKVKAKASTSASPFSCKICGRVYMKTGHYLRHMRRHENMDATFPSKPNKFSCEHCDKRFGSKGLLTIHMRFHSGEKVYKCNVCSASFFTPYQLNGHRLTTSHGRAVVCSSETNIPRRQKYKIKKNEFQCNSGKENETVEISDATEERITDNVEAAKSCDDDKMNADDGSQDSQAAIANNVPSNSSSRGDTNTSVTQIIFYQCHICKEIVNSKDLLEIHMESHRKVTNKFYCTFCDTHFAYRKTWVLHQQTHVKDLPKDENNSTAVTCDVCKKEFPHVIALNWHSVVHAKSNESPSHVCKYCDQIYYSKSKLLVHERGHTGEKPFVCPICTKSFTSVPSLRMHQESHDTELKCCTLCPKKFKSARNLKLHQNVHNNIKSFECKLCGYSYETKSRLQIHMKSKLHAGFVQQNSVQDMEVPFPAETVTVIDISEETVD